MNQYSQISNAQTSNRQHDADGNLTSDGVKQYQWDGENRLIAVKQESTTIAEYAYDYQSRRISKTVGASVKSFVYDGWNPIAEYTSALSPLSFTLSTSFTWGMDLSGSMQGAGGVGGLLAVKEFNTYYPTFDGNGNVSEYVDAAGNVVAHYEYDTFGQVVASGTKKDDFTHQFSTKQLDSESGLHYYGYRYYDSSNGRWLGRDPIQELGGLNLYGFVGNNGIARIDVLGLKVYVIFYYSKGGTAFKLAAETKKRDIEGREDFDPKCDEVVLIGVLTADELKRKWKEQADKSNSGSDDDLVERAYLYMHSGKGSSGSDPQLNLKDSELMEKDIEALAKMQYTTTGEVHCKGCRSGLPGSGGEDSVAKNLNDSQGVPTYGETGYGTFSENPNRKGLIHRLSDNSDEAYLNAYGVGGEDVSGYGPIKDKAKVDNGTTTRGLPNQGDY